MDINQFIEENKVIVIVRRLYGEKLMQLADALEKGGIKLMEVTFDQSDPDCVKNTSDTINMLKTKFGDRMRFGAGTVLTVEQVEAAASVGAEYIISPNVNLEVIKRTKELGLISIPGAMTPTEIITADQAGADYVKIFPIIDLGLKYMKNIMGPISHVKFIATAGVNEENFADILNAGFSGAGISGRLTDKKLIEAGNFEEFTNRARVFMEIARNNGKEV